MSSPSRIPRRSARAVAALALFALAAILPAGGCSTNKPGTLLAPTGVRPAPAVPTGGMWGYLVYDPAHYAGLDHAPFPPTRLDVYNDSGVRIDTLVIGGESRRFEFDRLPAGRYVINVRSHAFKPGSFGWYTISTAIHDVGDLGLAASTDSLASTVFVIGDHLPGEPVISDESRYMRQAT